MSACGVLFDDGAYGAQRCSRVAGHRGGHGTTAAERIAALDRLDPPVGARTQAARSLRLYGRQIAEVMDGLTEPSDVEAAEAIDSALDLIDSAIRSLEGDDETCANCGRPLDDLAAPGEPCEVCGAGS